MIRLSKQTDYGILLLAQLAQAKTGETASASELSAETRIPLPTVSKILKALTRYGLLSSHRGVNGGYSLSADPREITVADIIEAMEGGVAFTECVYSPGDCKHEPTCGVRLNWRKINDAVRSALATISLEDMAQPLTQELIPLSEPLTTARVS